MKTLINNKELYQHACIINKKTFYKVIKECVKVISDEAYKANINNIYIDFEDDNYLNITATDSKQLIKHKKIEYKGKRQINCTISKNILKQIIKNTRVKEMQEDDNIYIYSDKERITVIDNNKYIYNDTHNAYMYPDINKIKLADKKFEITIYRIFTGFKIEKVNKIQF